MASTIRNGANSSFGTSLNDSAAGATLFVAIDGFYTGTANPVVLSGASTNAAPSTATVAGLIGATMTSGATGFKDLGHFGSLSVLSTGTISGFTAVSLAGENVVNNEGTIRGSVGIASTGPNLEVVNAGRIYAYGDAITKAAGAPGYVTLYNSGSITGQLKLGDSSLTLDNSGNINGSITVAPSTATAAHTIKNSGVITGSYTSQSGVNDIENSNKILGEVKTSGTGPTTIVNNGFIGNGIVSSTAISTIHNDGQVGANIKFVGGELYNLGDVRGSVTASGAFAYVVNKGSVHGTVWLNSHSAGIAANSGTIDGALMLGDADDSVSNSGLVKGTISLKAGDDTFTGGELRETVNGGTGKDKIDLAGGDDLYIASAEADGDDSISGGDGSDTYWAQASSAGVAVNLATGAASGLGIGNDKIIGFERVVGSNFNDKITGDISDNALKGGAGDDALLGGLGNDSLVGDAGADQLTGGLGRDALRGGAGADTFFYMTLSESAASAARCDIIYDFEQTIDKINLAGIDASALATGNNAFSFLGSADFTGVAGELRYETTSGATLLMGDVNGDRTADFSVVLNSVVALAAADFVL